MGHLPVQEAKSHVGMRVCTMYVCLCVHTGVHARFGGFPSQAQVLLGLRPLHPPPVPVHALAHPQPHCSLPRVMHDLLGTLFFSTLGTLHKKGFSQITVPPSYSWEM